MKKSINQNIQYPTFTFAFLPIIRVKDKRPKQQWPVIDEQKRTKKKTKMINLH